MDQRLGRQASSLPTKNKLVWMNPATVATAGFLVDLWPKRGRNWLKNETEWKDNWEMNICCCWYFRHKLEEYKFDIVDNKNSKQQPMLPLPLPCSDHCCWAFDCISSKETRRKDARGSFRSKNAMRISNRKSPKRMLGQAQLDWVSHQK